MDRLACPAADRLVEHDPRWRQAFEQARSMIFDATEGRIGEVEHIGSTAFAGLPARPTIDVAARIDRRDLEEGLFLLRGLGYRDRAGPAELPGVGLLSRPRVGPATHHLYLATTEEAWAAVLSVHDCLGWSRERREQFARDKRQASAAAGEDDEAYTRIKSDLFAALLEGSAS